PPNRRHGDGRLDDVPTDGSGVAQARRHGLSAAAAFLSRCPGRRYTLTGVLAPRRRIPARPRALPAVSILAACLGAVAIATTIAARAGLPTRLTDQEFWGLVNDLSEQNGSFRSDNLLSNEARFQFVIPALLETTRSGGAYMGVGPEQNFTYIAAVKPGMAFIIDIRRGNLDLHLMYKVLFELSADRAEFVSRLFSRRRPPALRAASTAA